MGASQSSDEEEDPSSPATHPRAPQQESRSHSHSSSSRRPTSPRRYPETNPGTNPDTYQVGQPVEYLTARGTWVPSQVERVLRGGHIELVGGHLPEPRDVRRARPDNELLLLSDELDRLADRATLLVQRVREMAQMVHRLTEAGGAAPHRRELRQMEQEGRWVMQCLQDCCHEMEALALPPRGSLQTAREEALGIARDAIQTVVALGAALGAELTEEVEAVERRRQRRARDLADSPAPAPAPTLTRRSQQARAAAARGMERQLEQLEASRALVDGAGSRYQVGDRVQYSSDSHGMWIPAQIRRIQDGAMDLSVLSSDRAIPLELRGKRLEGVSPHKVRRQTHRVEHMPLSPVTARFGSADDDVSALRRIETNGGTQYRLGNQVEYSSNSSKTWLPATIEHIDSRGKMTIACEDGYFYVVPSHKLRHTARRIEEERHRYGAAALNANSDTAL
jgi:hypothetical protein